MIAGKIWGTTRVIISTPLFEMHQLFVNPESWCSWHHHNRKSNAFLVTHGLLLVEVKKPGYRMPDVTMLLQGDVIEVRPGEEHRFSTGCEGATLFEFYYLTPIGEDIVRSSKGGTCN